MSQVGYIIAPPLTINYHGWWVGKILSWLRWLFGETVVRGNDAGKDDGGGGRAAKLCPQPRSSLIVCRAMMVKLLMAKV